MAETTLEAPRASKCRGKLFLSAITGFALFCIAASLTALVLSFTLFCADCPYSLDSFVVHIYWAPSILLFLAGVYLLGSLAFSYKKRQNRVPTPRVVISFLPAEDLERSTVATLPCNHLPHGQPFATTPSTDLPDYFTAVQNADALYSSVGADGWREDDKGTLPPSYEEALEMSASAVTARDVDVSDSKQRNNAGDTRL